MKKYILILVMALCCLTSCDEKCNHIWEPYHIEKVWEEFGMVRTEFHQRCIICGEDEILTEGSWTTKYLTQQ